MKSSMIVVTIKGQEQWPPLVVQHILPLSLSAFRREAARAAGELGLIEAGREVDVEVDIRS